MRRSVIAALALGGSLAVAATASATSIPTGASTDATNASLNGLANQANTALVNAEDLIVGANALAAGGAGTAVDTSFTSAFTKASDLTATNVPKIAADIAASANTQQLELTLCVQFDQTANPTDSTSTAVGKCSTSGNPSMAQAVAYFTGTVQPGVAAAAASWANLNSLVAVTTYDPTDFPGGFYTVDGDVSLSSTATVTGIGKPVAYTATFGVSGPAATGYVLPSGFTLTFPANFTVNAALVAKEIQASQEANPPAASAIGTATVTSPAIAAIVPGSKGVDSGAQVFVVQGATLTSPLFEVYLGQGYYILGTLSGVTFPLTVTFGEPSLNGTPTALPVSSVTLNFPAATSPLQATSCTDLGTLTGTMTDALSTWAATYFGDSSDSGAQTMTATPTAVTNQCASATGTMGGLKTGSPTLRVHISTGNAFKTVTIGLPKGLKFVKAKAKVLRKEVSGGAKSARIARGKLVVTLKRSVKVVTINTKRGLISESAALVKSIRKHKTKTLKISVNAGGTALTVSIKA